MTLLLLTGPGAPPVAEVLHDADWWTCHVSTEALMCSRAYGFARAHPGCPCRPGMAFVAPTPPPRLLWRFAQWGGQRWECYGSCVIAPAGRALVVRTSWLEAVQEVILC